MSYDDQLTIERIQGAQAVRINSENDIMQLRGFIPAVTDWHGKVSFFFLSCYNNSVLFSTTLFLLLNITSISNNKTIYTIESMM